MKKKSVKGKTTSPVQLLKSAVAKRQKSRTELSELRKLLAEKSTQRSVLETTGNLNDKAVITELGQLQVLVELLPRRIAAKEEDDVKAEKTLTEATNEFIQEHLGPRVRQLAERTREIVRSELSSHFRDPAALTIAVAKSERVRSIERLSWTATLHPERGAIEHAEGALKAWQDSHEFERAL